MCEMYSIQTGNISCLVWFLWSMESIETFCCQRARLLFKFKSAIYWLFEAKKTWENLRGMCCTLNRDAQINKYNCNMLHSHIINSMYSRKH